MARLAACGELFGKNGFLGFKLRQLALIDGDDPGGRGFDYKFEQGVGLLLDFREFGPHALGNLRTLGQPVVPGIAEQASHQIDKALRRAHVLQNSLEAVLDIGAPDRLAVVAASLGVTQIIGMPCAGLAARPAAPIGLAATGAGDEAAQREIGIDVLARRRLRPFGHALLHPLEGLHRDQPFMLALEAGDSPFRDFDQPGIDRIGEQLGDAPLAQFAVWLFAGKAGLGFEKAFHLDLRAETAARVSLEGFGNDRGQRLVTDQGFALTLGRDVAVSGRGLEGPVSGLDAGAHLLAHLPSVLLALQFALRGHDRLDELAFGRLLDLEVETFDAGVAALQFPAQLEMEFGIAREAFEIVEDDDIILTALGTQIAQQGDHAGPVHEVAATGHIIGEHRLDIVTARFGIATAAMFLGFQPAAVDGLFLGGDAAIDHGSRLAVR